MKRTSLLISLLFISAVVMTASAQTQKQNSTTNIRSDSNATADSNVAKPLKAGDNTGAEIEVLKRRIEELETQNRTVLETLARLETRLNATNYSLTNDKPSTSASASQPSAITEPKESESQTTTTSKNQPVSWGEIIGEGNKIKLYGFLRLDLLFDSQRPNNAQTILFITSPDPRIGTDNGNFTMHPRLTRLGIDWSGPQIAKLGDAKLTGKLETDFQNGGTESRQIIRIRHAYLRLGGKDFHSLEDRPGTWFHRSFLLLIPTPCNGMLAM